MDKAELKRIAVEAAMERVVGTSTVPARYVASLVKMMSGFVDEFKAVKNSVFSAKSEMEKRVEELDKALSLYYNELARLAQIKGEKGDPGAPGKDGVNGRDGKDAQPVDVDKLKKQILKLIRQPEDGKDAVVDDERLEKMLDKALTKHKERLENEVASYRNQLAGKIYGKDTFVRGGGMTMSAGSNVTLVPKADGTVEINASGGGSGTNVTTQYQLTAVQSGSNITIALSQLTHFATFSDLIAIYRNNVMQTEGIDFTVAGNVVTVNGADASEIFNITYAYA